MLKRSHDLKNEIFTFMEMKGMPILEMSDDSWICGLALLVDFISYLNDLTLKLQGRSQFILHSNNNINVF